MQDGKGCLLSEATVEYSGKQESMNCSAVYLPRSMRFDVMAEEPASKCWRSKYDRSVALQWLLQLIFSKQVMTSHSITGPSHIPVNVLLYTTYITGVYAELCAFDGDSEKQETSPKIVSTISILDNNKRVFEHQP